MHRIILDTDPGTDDAMAMAMFLSHPENFEVMAITSVFGNVPIDTSTDNACRILEALGELSIPVYKGASKAVDLKCPSDEETGHIHGMDGMNDRPDLIPAAVSKTYEREMSAAEAICKLTSTHPGEISLVAIGPLTNLAEALALSPDLPQRVKDVWIMGTATQKGNVTPYAEFNTFMDPAATETTLREFSRHTTVNIIPWDTCQDNYITFPQLDEISAGANSDSPYTRVFEAVYMPPWSVRMRAAGRGYIMADQFLPMIMAYPECVDEVVRYGEVEVNTERGEERFGQVSYNRGEGSEEGRLCVWTRLDMNFMVKMLCGMLK